jgi:hypothetical protein
MRIYHSAILGSRAHRPLRPQCFPSLIIAGKRTGKRPRHAGKGEEEKKQLAAVSHVEERQPPDLYQEPKRQE